MTPADPVWVDVWLPAGDPLWRDDVGRAFDWLGEAWAAALGRSGITGLSAHREGYVACTRWATSVCFGGVGTGEVVTADGRKVVGLAQRRNRHGAWFHGACYLHWDPARLVDLLAMSVRNGRPPSWPWARPPSGCRTSASRPVRVRSRGVRSPTLGGRRTSLIRRQAGPDGPPDGPRSLADGRHRPEIRSAAPARASIRRHRPHVDPAPRGLHRVQPGRASPAGRPHRSFRPLLAPALGPSG